MSLSVFCANGAPSAVFDVLKGFERAKDGKGRREMPFRLRMARFDNSASNLGPLAALGNHPRPDPHLRSR